MKNICFIVGAGDFTEEKLSIPSGSYLIAADGGYEHLKRLGIEPDMVLGDFDSTPAPKHPNVVKHPPMKDDTDMLLAVKTGLKMGYKNFILLGGMGGRLDHTLANIQALVYLSRRGARGILFGAGTAMSAITNSKFNFDASACGIVSVFCSGDKAEGVNLTGLKYPLIEATLTDEMPLGVSNEFTGAPSEISVKKGSLIILWQESLENIIGTCYN
jgi:thiamine pyrophosphokinase